MTADRARDRTSSNAIPWPLKRDPSEIRLHPHLGEYVEPPSSWTDGLWTHCRETPHGERFQVTGRSRHPTDVQVRLWNEIDERLPQLQRAAIDAVPEPPVEPPTIPFSKESLALDEVRMEQDGSFLLFFSSPSGDELGAWPMVTFRDWKITASHWVP